MSKLNKSTLAALFNNSSGGVVSLSSRNTFVAEKRPLPPPAKNATRTTLHQSNEPQEVPNRSKPVNNRKRKRNENDNNDNNDNDVAISTEPDLVAPGTKKKLKKIEKTKLEKLKDMKDRLKSSRFRYINEMLYTSTSKEAVKTFNSDPESFSIYHQGYKRQIEKWPVKPIDLAIKFVEKRPMKEVIADLGCGEAMLAASVPHKVHSFDLKAVNDRVKIADMAKLPLKDESVNVVIYCLSLMGTNLTDFITEAHRILSDGGLMWIAEVASRFEGDLQTFSEAVEEVGFKCMKCNTDMTHFVTLTFKKVANKAQSSGKKKSKQKAGSLELSLAPCLYKKR